jgi:hypothetical protein
MKIRHAVLFRIEEAAYLIYLKDDGQSYGFHLVAQEPVSLADLLELAIAAPFDRYWIMASAKIEPARSWAEYDQAAWDLRIAWDKTEKFVQSIHGWRKPAGGQKSIDLIWPQFTRWAKDRGQPAWGSLASPKQFLMVIHWLEQALKIDVKGSPASTGWSLAKSLHHRQITETPDKKLASLHFDARSAFDLIDSRVPTEEELRRKYLIKLDKNSAYIAAAKSEFYGVGTPTHSSLYAEDAVGVWRVNIHTLADVPFPIVTRTGERWLASPLVRLLRTRGYEVEVCEGYVFLEKYMLLKAWSQRIWDARISFRDEPQRWPFETSRKHAEAACKMIAVATIGITAYGQFRAGEESDKERPDIKLITIARNYEIMDHNIMKAWQEDGILPVLIFKDCVCVLVDDLDPIVSAPGYMLRNGQSREKMLGGYKREGYMEVTPAVCKILTSADHAPQKKRALDQIGWQN